MNNVIQIKDADFSKNKVGLINSYKLDITKAGNGFARITNGAVEIATIATWNPYKQLCYSNTITLQSGIWYFYGITNIILPTNIVDDYINSNTLTKWGYTIPGFCYKDSNNVWRDNNQLSFIENNKKPVILARKDNLYNNNEYTALKIMGPLFGSRFAYDITDVIFNWVRHDEGNAPEIGMVVPEIYGVCDNIHI